MEEINFNYLGVDYKEIPMLIIGKCTGCVFEDAQNNCTRASVFPAGCSRRGNVWVKKKDLKITTEVTNGVGENKMKVKEVKLEPKATDIQECAEYETKASVDGCKGCTFNNGKGICTKPVGLGEDSCYSIIWKKKEQRSDRINTSQEGYKLDDDKLQYSLIPPLALEAVARNLTAGLCKYPPNNWKKVQNAEQRYLNALFRHLEAHRKGEVYDTESPVTNMPHLAAVAVNAMFLLEFLLDPNIKDTK